MGGWEYDDVLWGGKKKVHVQPCAHFFVFINSHGFALNGEKDRKEGRWNAEKNDRKKGDSQFLASA